MYADADVSLFASAPVRPELAVEAASPPVLWLRFTTTLATRPYCPK
jgi:hypothetical protein